MATITAWKSLMVTHPAFDIAQKNFTLVNRHKRTQVNLLGKLYIPFEVHWHFLFHSSVISPCRCVRWFILAWVRLTFANTFHQTWQHARSWWFLVSFQSNSEKPERAPKQSCACNIRRLTQGIDAVSKGKQRSVDVSAFYHSFATILQRKEGFTFTSNNVTAPAHAKLLQHPFELASLNQRHTVILLK